MNLANLDAEKLLADAIKRHNEENEPDTVDMDLIKLKLVRDIAKILGVEEKYIALDIMDITDSNQTRVGVKLFGYKLAASFSLQAMQDIRAIHDINIEEEIYDSLSYEIIAELNYNNGALIQQFKNNLISVKLDKLGL